MFSVDTQQLKNGILISITELTNHVDVNLKPWFLIKSGYYIVPSLSTALLKGIVDQCHVEDLILVPAGHYWTRKSGLVDYYQPEWDCDGYTGQ